LALVGFVFQTSNLFGHLSTRDNIALPHWRLTGSRGRALAEADALLARFGLERRADTPAARLSAGEAQRAAVARALVNRPLVVFADEPTGSLDSANAEQVMQALGEVQKNGAALLVATHDPGVGSRGRPLRMRDGRLLADQGSVES
jgi:ABC-type lipoprotein export system ATPase subunit